MTRLLVSVRSAAEARAALGGGADLIDVKEPSRGSLGAAAPCVWNEVRAVVNNRAPLSAALGELIDFDHALAPGHLAGFHFAKLGMAGCTGIVNWPARWARALRSLPAGVAPVAVAYADWNAALAPPPEQILRAAVELGCAALLVDTFDKSAGGLFDVMDRRVIEHLVKSARRRGLLVALAGSLTSVSIRVALDFEPDIVAVRGAVCDGNRTGVVRESAVREIAELIQRHARSTFAEASARDEVNAPLP